MVYFFRFIRYFLWRILMLAVIVGLVALSFFVCMDYMNVNILIRDGFYKRASTIIMGDDPSILVKVFTKSFIDKDTLLKSQVYNGYVIRGFNHSMDVDFVLIFPWDRVIHVNIAERIPYIDGELPQEQYEGEADKSEQPPVWQDARYRLALQRDGDNWKITDMEMLEYLEKPAPGETEQIPGASPEPSAPALPETAGIS